MGNKIANKHTIEDVPSAEINPPKKRPQLVRMKSGAVEEYECAICFTKEKKGLACTADHFMCKDCFSPYVHSICDDRFKLVEVGGKIKCPVPDCAAESWSSHEVLQVASPDVVEQYIDILVSCIGTGTHRTGTDTQQPGGSTSGASEAEKRLAQQQSDSRAIVNALTLVCPNPNCLVALDPSPDGCCAMKCAFCGVHFCWLCFQIQADSSKCHTHVRNCGENRENNLFVSKKEVDNVHRKRRVEAIRRVLQKLATQQQQEEEAKVPAMPQQKGKVEVKKSSGWAGFFGIAVEFDDSKLPGWKRQRFRLAVDGCLPILKGADIKSADIFSSDYTGPVLLAADMAAGGAGRLPVPLPIPQRGEANRYHVDGNNAFEWRSKRNSKVVALFLIIVALNIVIGHFQIQRNWFSRWEYFEAAVVQLCFVGITATGLFVAGVTISQHPLRIPASLILAVCGHSWIIVTSSYGFYFNFNSLLNGDSYIFAGGSFLLLEQLAFGQVLLCCLWLGAVLLTSLEVALLREAQADLLDSILTRFAQEAVRYNHAQEMASFAQFRLEHKLFNFLVLAHLVIASTCIIPIILALIWKIIQLVLFVVLILIIVKNVFRA